MLIYATGFEVQQTGIYNRIVGEHGARPHDKYADGIRTLLGIHTHGYPNLFIMGGYQASFQFNLTDLLQVQGDHIANCIDYVRAHGYATIDCAPEAEEWWVQEVIAQPRQDQPQRRVHARLLQLRGRRRTAARTATTTAASPAYIDHIGNIEAAMETPLRVHHGMHADRPADRTMVRPIAEVAVRPAGAGDRRLGSPADRAGEGDRLTMRRTSPRSWASRRRRCTSTSRTRRRSRRRSTSTTCAASSTRSPRAGRRRRATTRWSG